jgi:hypothetical protein
MARQQAHMTKEEAMKRVFSLLASAAFLCVLTNTALADDNSIGSQAREDHSLLSTWDKPAFSPAPYMDSVPWLDSRPAKGQHVDFLMSPKLESIGPLLAQKGSWPASSEAAPRQAD